MLKEVCCRRFTARYNGKLMDSNYQQQACCWDLAGLTFLWWWSYELRVRVQLGSRLVLLVASLHAQHFHTWCILSKAMCHHASCNIQRREAEAETRMSDAQ